MKEITMQTVSDKIAELNIRTIELQYLDPTGEVHSMILNAHKRKKMNDEGEYKLVPLEPHQIAGTLDGSSILGFQTIDNTGLEVVPGPNPRIYVDPTDETRLVIMGNTKEPNGPLYAKDPRNQAIIAEQWLKSQNLGLKAMRVGPEFEFFVFPKDADPFTLEMDNTAYHSSASNNPYQKFMEKYLLALPEAGVPSKFFHSEVAGGKKGAQQEIGVDCETLLRAADNVIIAREILKKLAAKDNLTVSWEPKLLDAYGKALNQIGEDKSNNGNGLHTNLSLDTDNQDKPNAFVKYNKEGEPIANELSDDANLSIAGLLKHAHALQAFCNPSTISGARLGMGESPVVIGAGPKNRSAAVRIPEVDEKDVKTTRVEFRASDSMACPHTWFVAVQMAMVDAIKQGRTMSHEERIKNGLVPQIIKENFYHMSEEKRRSLSLRKLHTGPDILMKSIQSLKDDHDFLLDEKGKGPGPFGESFEFGVLESYVNTILAKDAYRENLRKIAEAKWIKAHPPESPKQIALSGNNQNQDKKYDYDGVLFKQPGKDEAKKSHKEHQSRLSRLFHLK